MPIDLSLPFLIDKEYEDFKTEFETLSGINLSLYKEKQMKRRINTLITRKGLSNYSGLLEVLKNDSEKLAAFVDYITINVTDFFRTPEQWNIFVDTALSELLKRKDKIKIWSCACSTGQEPYSLAMSILKMASEAQFEILATDIDDTVLDIARNGVYDVKSLENLPRDMIEFFDKQGTQYKISEKIKKHVSFSKIDLLRDEYPQDCDIIVCRNVLIYFTESGKQRVYQNFCESIKPGSYIFTGSTEQILNHKPLGLKKLSHFLYSKE